MSLLSICHHCLYVTTVYMSLLSICHYCLYVTTVYMSLLSICHYCPYVATLYAVIIVQMSLLSICHYCPYVTTLYAVIIVQMSLLSTCHCCQCLVYIKSMIIALIIEGASVWDRSHAPSVATPISLLPLIKIPHLGHQAPNSGLKSGSPFTTKGASSRRTCFDLLMLSL